MHLQYRQLLPASSALLPGVSTYHYPGLFYKIALSVYIFSVPQGFKSKNTARKNYVVTMVVLAAQLCHSLGG